jgi:hypothetical protein
MESSLKNEGQSAESNSFKKIIRSEMKKPDKRNVKSFKLSDYKTGRKRIFFGLLIGYS